MFNFTGQTMFTGQCTLSVCPRAKPSKKKSKTTVGRIVTIGRVTTQPNIGISTSGHVISSRVKSLVLSNADGKYYVEREGASWTKLGYDIASISDSAYGTYEGKIYLFGGVQNQTLVVGSFRVFDPVLGTVVLMNSPTQPSPRKAPTGAVLGTKFYILGGSADVGYTGWYDEMWSYDFITEVWTLLNTIPNLDGVGTYGRGDGLMALDGALYAFDVNHWFFGLYIYEGFARYNVGSNNWTKGVLNPDITIEPYQYPKGLFGYRGHLWYIVATHLYRMSPQTGTVTIFTLGDNVNAPLVGYREHLIYPMGSFGQDDTQGTNDAFYYNIDRAEFGKLATTGNDASTPRTTIGHAVGIIDDKLYLIGGENVTENTAYADIYMLNLKEFFYDDNNLK